MDERLSSGSVLCGALLLVVWSLGAGAVDLSSGARIGETTVGRTAVAGRWPGGGVVEVAGHWSRRRGREGGEMKIRVLYIFN